LFSIPVEESTLTLTAIFNHRKPGYFCESLAQRGSHKNNLF
jgi:hypothetical protein